VSRKHTPSGDAPSDPGGEMMRSGANPGLRPGDLLRLKLERPAAEGLTVALHEGRVILVARGVPGEEVDARIERVEARHALARVVTVRAASPHRVTAPCPHYPRCGGCDVQHVAYAEQLRIKRAAFLDQLARIGGIAEPADFEIEPAPEPLRYRDRLDFLLHGALLSDARPGGTPSAALVPAFHGPSGAPPEAIADCLLAPAALTALARAAGAALAALPAPERPSRLRVQSCTGSDGGPALALTLFADTDARARKLARNAPRWLPGLLAAQPALHHAGIAPGPGEDDGAEGAQPGIALHGEATLTKPLGALRYRVPPEGFFQVHQAVAGRIVRHVVESVQRLAPPGPEAHRPLVLDLYCGAGLFTLPLAQAGYRVLGVEASAAAVRAARTTARDAGFAPGHKPEFKVRNLEASGALEDLVRREGVPEALVLDPPRRGLGAALVRGLLAVRPAWIVYVSCDGGSFSRDAARLAERYTLAGLRGFDLFPQTHHVELVGLFRRCG
jgi:23S rRNA (uracil1939-C5)-methyltransferase